MRCRVPLKSVLTFSALGLLVTRGLSGCSFAVDSSELDAGCSPGFKYCDGCVRVNDPAYGCKLDTCNPCELSNAVPTCLGTDCAVASCLAGWGCPPECSTPVLTDERNCGACGVPCSQGQLCVAGECVVPED